MVSRPEPGHLLPGSETEPSVVSTLEGEVFPPSPFMTTQGGTEAVGYNTRFCGRSSSRVSKSSRGRSSSAPRAAGREPRSVEGQAIGQAVAVPTVALLDIITDGAATAAVPELDTTIAQSSAISLTQELWAMSLTKMKESSLAVTPVALSQRRVTSPPCTPISKSTRKTIMSLPKLTALNKLTSQLTTRSRRIARNLLNPSQFGSDLNHWPPHHILDLASGSAEH